MAPSVLPHNAGDRVQTARRDAVQLARLRRSGDRTPGSVPTVEDEARRDRTRAREETRSDLKAATCRLTAVLLRHDRRYPGRATWGPAPRRWLAAVVCATPAPHLVFQASVRAVHEPTERLQRLEQALQEPVHTWRLQPVVEALPALRGGPCTVAVTIVAARGDLTHVDNPRPLMRYLGLTPSASSSGERRRQGAITTTGNTQARRALVEGAGAYRSPANVSRHRQLRLEKRPKTVQDSRWQAHGRRCKRDRTRSARGKHAHHVVVAIARELIACRWTSAKAVPLIPSNAQLVLEQRSSASHRTGRSPRMVSPSTA